jgi:hypothetical protein
MKPQPDPIEIELLVSTDCRRISIGDHEQWRQSLAGAPVERVDEIDLLVAELRAIQPEDDT